MKKQIGVFFKVHNIYFLVFSISQELGHRKAQLEYEHNMLVRHHESTQDLEYKHLAAIQKLRDEQLRKQHESERENQKQYTARAEQELRKKHSLEVRQQPRSLRVNIFFISPF